MALLTDCEVPPQLMVCKQDNMAAKCRHGKYIGFTHCLELQYKVRGLKLALSAL